MKDRDKREVQIIVSILLLLLAAALYFEYGIVSKSMEQYRASAEPEEQEVSGWDLSQSFGADDISVIGRAESDDYPYGYNAGYIEDDEVGKAILLTPGTEIEMDVSQMAGYEMTIQYFIHPWVADHSDGAILNVEFRDDKGAVSVAAYPVDGEERKQEIPISGNRVKLFVTNEEKMEEACDWVIIDQLKIEK